MSEPGEPPHGPLPRFYGTAEERAGWVRGLFDRTAADYDRIEHVISLGSGSRYRRQALARAGLAPGMRVLDIGTGTGLTARQAALLVGPAGEVVGVDPSAGMLSRARVPPGVRLARGVAEAIPAPPESADFLCMGYALRHVGDLAAALGEFSRVLVPGGRVCLLEISVPEGGVARGLLKLYMRTLVPWLTRLLATHRDSPELMRYYWATIEACVPPARILSAMREAGFEGVERHVEFGVFSEYRGRRPG